MRKLFIFLCLALLSFSFWGCDNKVKITSISPSAIVANLPSFTLTVNGTDFSEDSVIVFNDIIKDTTFISSSQLTCVIETSDIPPQSTDNPSENEDYSVDVKVRTFPMGEGNTDSVQFTVKAEHSFDTPSRLTDDHSNLSQEMVIDFDDVLHCFHSVLTSNGWPLYYSSSSDHGDTWTNRVKITGEDRYTRNFTPFVDSSGALNLFYRNDGSISKTSDNRYYYIRSEDRGLSWSAPGLLFPGKNNVLSFDFSMQADGSILFAQTYDNNPTLTLSFALYSSDGWSYGGIIDETVHYLAPLKMLKDENGKITVIYYKYSANGSSGLDADLYHAVSEDGGMTWNKAKVMTILSSSIYNYGVGTNIAANGEGKLFMIISRGNISSSTGISSDAQILRIKDSMKIIINGNIKDDRKVLGVSASVIDINSYMITSEDGGLTWTESDALNFGSSCAVVPDSVQIDPVGNINLSLLGISSWSPNYLAHSYFCRSIDGGLHWTGLTKVSDSDLGINSATMATSYSGDIYFIMTQINSATTYDYDSYFSKSFE